jgi:bifunctional polynucleotide phosphatase/kinase
VSNQGGISLKPDPKTVKSDQKRLADFKSKLSAVLTQLELPISVYAATARDHYRKPRTGMWQELLDDHDLNDPASVDLAGSFFVGDAGGREAVDGGAVKDHSCVDRYADSEYALLISRMLTTYRDFAANAGLTFHTPEEYFLHEESRPFMRDFDPLLYMKERGEGPTSARTFEIMSHVRRYTKTTVATPFTKPSGVDIILFCGSPGAGKSSYYWRNLQPLGYGRVNQDLLKTVRTEFTRAA